MNRKRVAAAFVVSLTLAAPATAVAAEAAAGQETARLALVVGNSGYAALPALPGCTASAHLVAATLKRAGFDVTERLDRTNGQMSGDLAALAEAAARRPGTIAVAYICGYAMALDDRAFLLPVSVRIDHDTDLLTQGVVAKSVLDTVKRSGAAGGLVLFDAVAKPGATAKLSFAALASVPSSDGVALAAAAMVEAPPEAASPFASALAAAIAAPDIEAGAVLKALQQRLKDNPAIELAVLAPTVPLWLAGGPVATPLVATPPEAAPPPAEPAKPPAPSASVAVAFPEEAHMSGSDRQRLQTALLHLGYYDGRVDGVFGPETRAAIRRYQHEIGAEMTGQVTPAQAGRLLAEGR
jgi:hypothetical protein